MAGVQRTPPSTLRPKIGSICQAESQSEPDISAAIRVSDSVKVNRTKRARKDNSPQSVSVETSSFDLHDTLVNWKKEQDSGIAKQLAEQTALISKLSLDIGDIKTQNNQIKASNAEISKTNTEITQSISFINKQFEELKTEVEILGEERREQQKYIEHLEYRILDLQLKSRSSGIELRNIPQESTETNTSLKKTVCNIGEAIGVPITATELRDVYRPQGKSTSTAPRPIIAEFITVQAKQSFISSVRAYNKGRGKEEKLNTAILGMSGDIRPVYISEYLPLYTKKLFYLAREFANKHSYKFCWISNGNIFLRRKEGDKQILVKNEKCLSLLEHQNGCK
ncbi:unnamed protein product [Arctia plantaginis]|uniref:FP protein C-terminal domain-containing protein n=1 Tax=Arctia plantaginis TaxID=874455 RepID=A0A8S0ZPQ6_ARCPL|nr:unnamed protein product [Arctia plantaginis]